MAVYIPEKIVLISRQGLDSWGLFQYQDTILLV